MSDVVGSNQPPQPIDPAPQPESRRRRLVRILGYMMVGVALLLLFYGVIALIAYQQGDTARRDRIAAEQTAAISRQMELAEADVANGNFELALRRIDYVLVNEPGHPDAQALFSEAQDGLNALLTPSPTPTPTVTPTPLPTATPTTEVDPNAFDVNAAQTAYDDGLELIADGDWEGGIAQLEQVRIRYPDFRVRDVSEVLYDAYITWGLTLTRSIEIERGIFFLEKAAELGDLSEEVQGEIFWAEQYLAGIIYFGLDWPAYLSYFRPMCEFAPLYQNSCIKLSEGLVGYADQYALNLDWCPAEALYTEAIILGELDDEESERVAEAVTAAREFCLLATPTPTATPELELTPGIDGTLTVTTTNSITIDTGTLIAPTTTPTLEP